MKWRGKFVWKTFLVSSNCNLRVWKHTFFTNFSSNRGRKFLQPMKKKKKKKRMLRHILEHRRVAIWKERKEERREKKATFAKVELFYLFFFFLSTFILFQCKTVHNFKGYSLQILLRFEKVSYQRYFCSFEKTKSRIFLFSFFFLPPPLPLDSGSSRTIERSKGHVTFLSFFFRNSKKKKKKRTLGPSN